MKKFATLVLLLCASLMMRAENPNLDYPTDTIDGTIVYLYPVERSIGLYRVSVNFSVKQEDIIRWNPELRERGLRYDEVIRIPSGRVLGVAPKVPAVAKEPVVPKIQEPAAPAPQEPEVPLEVEVPQEQSDSLRALLQEIILRVDSVRKSGPLDMDEVVEDNTLRIAYLLPLQASVAKRDNSIDRFVDFYEGALIALYDLQLADQRFEVFTYDVDKTDTKIRQLIADSSLRDMDLIIGPAYPMQVMAIAEYAREQKIQTVIPFVDYVDGIESNPYLMQFNSTDQREAEAIADYLSQLPGDINCVLVDAKQSDMPESVRQLRGAIEKRGIATTHTTVHDILSDSLSYALRPDADNYLLFSSDRYSNLQVVMPRILAARGNSRLTLISQFAWQRENILLPQIYATVFATDAAADETHYDQIYQQYFGHEHASTSPRYDLLGYDLTRQVIALMQGKEYFGLQSDIHFDKLPDGGYINTHISVLRK